MKPQLSAIDKEKLPGSRRTALSQLAISSARAGITTSASTASTIQRRMDSQFFMRTASIFAFSLFLCPSQPALAANSESKAIRIFRLGAKPLRLLRIPSNGVSPRAAEGRSGANALHGDGLVPDFHRFPRNGIPIVPQLFAS